MFFDIVKSKLILRALHFSTELKVKNPEKSRKIDKLAVPNKSVQGGSLVEIKEGVQVRLLGTLE